MVLAIDMVLGDVSEHGGYEPQGLDGTKSEEHLPLAGLNSNILTARPVDWHCVVAYSTPTHQS